MNATSEGFKTTGAISGSRGPIEHPKCEWFPSPATLGGHACMKHRVTRELCLYGRNGEIWLSSDPESTQSEPGYACAVWGQYSAKKMETLLSLPSSGPKHRGEEIAFRFKKNHLPEVVRILDVPKTRPAQIRYWLKRRFPKCAS